MVKENKTKQTEIGLLPEDWEVVDLKTLINEARPIRYGVVQPGVYNSKGCLMLRSQDYSKGWKGTENMHRVISSIENQYRGTKLIDEDLVMTIVGAGLGQIVKLPSWINGTLLSRSTARISINDIAKSDYIYQFLSSNFGFKQLIENVKEGAQPVISAIDISKTKIPLPPLPEQEAIAEALSDADAWIESLEQLIAKKRLIKQGAMQELLSPKGDWEVKKLGEMSNIYTGKKNNQDKIENGAYPFFVRSQTVERINSYSFDGEAILIPGEGNLGSIVHYINGKFDFHQRVYKISDFVGSNGKYLYWYFRMYFGNHAMQNTVKATVDSIRLPTLQEFKIQFPSLTEQSRIATILSDMDAELEALEVQLGKAREVKQGMMQELLTGRVRLV